VRKMTREFIAELETLIGGMGNALPRDATIDCKRLFSGAAAYANGRIFISLTPVGLAVKLAEPEKGALMQMGGTPLRYFPKAPVKKAYVVVPENLAANTDLLKPWLARPISYVLTLPDQRLALFLTNSRNARRPRHGGRVQGRPRRPRQVGHGEPSQQPHRRRARRADSASLDPAVDGGQQEPAEENPIKDEGREARSFQPRH